MFRPTVCAALPAVLALQALPAAAADSADLQAVRAEIEALRRHYDARIAELEGRLRQAESKAAQAESLATQAEAKASVAAAAPAPAPQPAPAPAAPVAANAFNPEISLILAGTYAAFSQNPDTYQITGFIPGGEIGPGKRGFSLGESELSFSGSVDPRFRGTLTVALTPDNEAEVEEAFVQTTALPHGFTLKAGRFLSGIGYLNEQHAHVWDFVDAPLAYQAFLGGQFGDDGVQLKWVAPTASFLELGAELGRGRSFPGSDNSGNDPDAAALYAHVGGDVGLSHAWRAGLSWLRATPHDREFEDSDTGVTNAFSGTSQLWLADFVWKWAPQGDARRSNFKLQGEYFWRDEDGTLTYDLGGVSSRGAYSSAQSGWYLQGVWQFMPAWRVGARWDQLYSGNPHFGANAAYLTAADYDPSRASLMVDWSPSEFSRLRLQMARDKARQDEADNQLFLQYIMSLGAHGGHSF